MKTWEKQAEKLYKSGITNKNEIYKKLKDDGYDVTYSKISNHLYKLFYNPEEHFEKNIFFDEIGPHDLFVLFKRSTKNHTLYFCRDIENDGCICRYVCLDHDIKYCSLNTSSAMHVYKRYSDKIA